MKKIELIIFEKNIEEYIDEQVNKTARNILNVVDAAYPKDDTRNKVRKVVLDSVNELGITLKSIIENLGKGV